MLTVFWDMEVPFIIDFIKNGSAVKSASYCLRLRQYSLNSFKKKKIVLECKVKLVTLVVGDPKALFSIATTLMFRGGFAQ